jgi:RNA polymerase sigma-70 factor (ECF subfamily)
MSEGYMALGQEAAHVDSFDLVFSVHHEYVYNLARALLRNTQDAEDVTQDVFIRVYKALPSYNPQQAGLRTWLAKMVVNACKTHRRRNFLRVFLRRPDDDGYNPDMYEPEDPSPWGAPETRALQSEVRQAVKDVLAKLRIEHRTVLVLHYYLDLSCPEIASILECPEGTIYSRLHYARRLVQTQLEGRMLSSTGEVEL